jgi:hypothetical protein
MDVNSSDFKKTFSTVITDGRRFFYTLMPAGRGAGVRWNG